uniref:pectate lyase-like adhesive domain-containing protein n=1 Tax=Alistipes sp. TaxID=1872444 RepID=UPI0040579AC0
NKQDRDRSTTTILIYGGTFKNFNPANNAAEGANTNFVAEGYTVAELESGVWAVVEGFGAVVTTPDAMVEALENGEDVIFYNDIKIDPATMSNAYGKTGINVKNGQTIDGGGNTLDIRGAGDTWDSGINTTGGVIKNLSITGSFRGVFVNHNSTHSEPVVLENVHIYGTTYTISCDQGMNQNLEATDCSFKGWTSYAATLGKASFTRCYFGEGNGYNFMRPFAPTTYVDCEFGPGFEMDPRAAVTFKNCKIDGVALTAANLSTLVIANIANATVIE